jgi:hypothetical protein
MSTSTTTLTEERALALLGSGVSPTLVASACGVDISRISQLASDPEFANKVASLRYENLSKHNLRDSKLDSLEDRLIEKLEGTIDYVMNPEKITRMLLSVNSMKRRGSSAPEAVIATKETVKLTMPVALLQQFNQNIQVNLNNQVVRSGDQELVTIQSSNMHKLSTTIKEINHDSATIQQEGAS